MCCSCGCGEPFNDHGDVRNITLSDLQAAADAAGLTLDDIFGNLQDCAEDIVE